jgi:hypothetical protein
VFDMQGTATCERCGNEYDKPIFVRRHDDDTEHVFDSFECAVDMLAPRCEHCGCRVVGHGVEEDGMIFCCASCGRKKGAERVVDRGDAVSVSGDAGRQPVAAPTRPPSDS